MYRRGGNAPKLSFQWQLFRKSSGFSRQSCFPKVLQLRFPKHPADKSLQAAYTVPSSDVSNIQKATVLPNKNMLDTFHKISCTIVENSKLRPTKCIEA